MPLLTVYEFVKLEKSVTSPAALEGKLWFSFVPFIVNASSPLLPVEKLISENTPPVFVTDASIESFAFEVLSVCLNTFASLYVLVGAVVKLKAVLLYM